MEDYLLTLLAAVLTFVSPCVLPLLPVYITYFAGGKSEEGKNGRLKTLFNALAFCLGITVFFMMLFVSAAFASFALRRQIEKWSREIAIVCGIILILFGLKFIGWLNLPFLDKRINVDMNVDKFGLIKAFLLGLVVAVSMGACAMTYASFSVMETIFASSFGKSILIGVVFTLTLDVLFIVCAMLVDQLKSVFGFIKRHYNIINIVSGCLLIAFGLLLALGILAKWDFGFEKKAFLPWIF